MLVDFWQVSSRSGRFWKKKVEVVSNLPQRAAVEPAQDDPICSVLVMSLLSVRPFGFPASNTLSGKQRHLLGPAIESRTRNPKGLTLAWKASRRRRCRFDRLSAWGTIRSSAWPHLRSSSKCRPGAKSAPLAQWTECRTSNPSVVRSNRTGGTRNRRGLLGR